LLEFIQKSDSLISKLTLTLIALFTRDGTLTIDGTTNKPNRIDTRTGNTTTSRERRQVHDDDKDQSIIDDTEVERPD